MGAGRYGLIFVVSKTFFFVRKRGTVSWAFLLRMTFFFHLGVMIFWFNSLIERAGNLNDLSSLITVNNLIHTGRFLHLSIGELTVKHPTPISVPKQLRAKKDS